MIECELSVAMTLIHSMETQRHGNPLDRLPRAGRATPSHSCAEPVSWPVGDAENQEQDGSLDASSHRYVFLLSTAVFHAEGRPDGQVEGRLGASLCSFIFSVRSVA